MPDDPTSLHALGWAPVFQQQLSVAEAETARPARVFAVQRSHLEVMTAEGGRTVVLGGRWFQLDAEERPTVGDWLLLDGDDILRLLERKSLLKRMNPGRGSEVQLIAANVDTLFVVSSCNEEFNAARLERYLALAYDAGVQPVVVLTKADLADDPEAFVAEVHRVRPDVPAEPVNARESAAALAPWLGPGQTVALLGSSGVGKSTLVNTLSGARVQLTREIREDDAKGRHTTTHRSLHVLPGGALVADSPGMRELALADADAGLGHLFEDLEALALRCRFADCAHGTEPGCAVRAAVEAGEVPARRLDSWLKLKREERYASESIAERHARSRALGKMYKRSQEGSPKRRG